MAYSKPSKDLSASILAGSEEMYDYFCQPCSSEQHLEAAGYCQECCQYLCVACIKYHRKLSSTEHHTVLDKSVMPKTKLPKRAHNTDILTAKCLKHPGQVLEYFCKTHNQICCNVCISLNHRSCTGKSYIPNISGGIANSQEFRKLKAEIYRLVGEIRKLQDKINVDNKNNGKFHGLALADIKDFRKQINELLNKLEEDTKRKVTKIHQENVKRIETASETYQSLLSEVFAMTANMATSETAGNNNQMFVQVKLFCNRIAEVERQVNETGRNKITRYAFNQYENTQQMVSTLSAIWSLSVGKDVTPINARYVREVNVKADDDTEECGINDVTVLTNGRGIVTDGKNKNIKLIDMNINIIVCRLSMSSEPLGITYIKPSQVAVALGNEYKIGILTVTNTLSLSQTIKTPGAGIAGLCYNGSNFIAACYHPACIKIIDMSGRTLNTIRTGNNGEQLFSLPSRIALSRDEDVIYTTDIDANTVTSITPSSQVIFVYRNDKLNCPSGLVVGKDGTLYVSSCANYSIHQVTSTGDFKQIILSHDQGLTIRPGAIACRDDMLYINSRTCTKPELRNCIRIYQLE